MISDDPSTNSHYSLIIEQIRAGTLQADDRGILQLPSQYAAASSGGRVLVEINPRNILLVAFATWVGKGFNMRGYLYASNSLTEEDTFQDYYGNRSINMGPTELVLINQIKEHWYSVSRDLD